MASYLEIHCLDCYGIVAVGIDTHTLGKYVDSDDDDVDVDVEMDNCVEMVHTVATMVKEADADRDTLHCDDRRNRSHR